MEEDTQQPHLALETMQLAVGMFQGGPRRSGSRESEIAVELTTCQNIVL